MPTISRWRNWHPGGQKIGECLDPELTKLTKPPSETQKSTFVSFVSSPPGHMQNFFGPEPEPRRELFSRWLSESCVQSDRFFSAIADLHIDYCAWTHEPCTRSEFESLLIQAGYLLADGLANGLMLQADILSDVYERLERLAIQAESGVL